MKKKIIQLTVLGGLLLLGACTSMNNCSGNSMITNPGYCTGTLHPNAGPYTGAAKM